MASTLNTKINSYAIETGIELSQAYSLVPSQTGTHTEPSSFYWQKSGRDPVFQSTVNPPNGSGSWQLLSNGTNTCYHRTNGGAIIGRFTDHDWSTGAFVKITAVPTGIALTSPFFRLNPSATSGFEWGVQTYADSTPPQIYIKGGGAENILLGQLVLDRWYLFSVRRVGNTMTFFIDGQVVSTQTRNSTTLQSEFGWGFNVFYSFTMNVSNIYVSSSSVITPTAITDIYLTGLNLTPTNVSVAASPFTATAAPGPGHQRLQVETVKSIGLLHKKINSYAIETGIELNSSYQLPPTQTGTVTDTNAAAWTLLGGGTPTFEPLIGPNNGKGSWNFKAPAGTTTSSRFRTTSSSITSRLNDFNISEGFWFKWNSIPNTNSVSGLVALRLVNPQTTMGYGISIGWSATAGKFVYALQYKSAVVYLEGANDPQVETNKWHYWAVRRNGNPGTYEFYYDGALVYTTETITSSTTVATNMIWGLANNSSVSDIDVNISNIYIAPYATIDATAIAEIWDTGNSQALQKLSSNIYNVTTGYDLVRSIRFNENYKDPYTQTGTAPLTTAAQFDFTGTAPVWTPGEEGQSDGGWTYTASNTVNCRTRDSGSILDYLEYDSVTGYTTSDWSAGFWVKINNWVSEANVNIIQTEGNTTQGFSIGYALGSSVLPGSTVGKKQFYYRIANGSTTYFGEDLDLKTGEWYYFALRQNAGSVALYFNGLAIIKDLSVTEYPTANLTYLTIGHGFARAHSFTISNFYVAKHSVLGSAGIKNIWLARNTLTVNKNVFALTADADMLGMPQKGPTATASATIVEPTIAATIGDNTEIFTSITASALMPDPIILTGQWILVPNIQLGTANAQSVFPFNIETNLDKNVSVLPMTADALLQEPRVAERPFIASALFVNPTLDIDENYFQKVTDLNPIIYINDGQTSPVNYGSMNESGYYNQNILFNQDSTQEMQAINNTKSWKSGTLSGSSQYALFRTEFSGTEWANKLTQLYTSRRLTIEFWYYSLGTVKQVSLSDPNNPLSPPAYTFPVESGPLFNDGITELTEVYGGYSSDPNTPNKMILIGERMRSYNVNDISVTATWRDYPDANPERNDWNHIVITYEPQVDANRVRRYIYLNGAIVSNLSLQLTYGSGLTETPTNDLLSIDVTNAPEGPFFGGRIQLSGSESIRNTPGVMWDEFAYYPITMTASQVLDHYSFVKAQSPDETIFADSFEAIAAIADADFLPVANFEYDADPVTALAAQIPQPVVTTGFDRVFNAGLMTGQAFILEPEHSHGSTIAHTEFVVYAESPAAFHLNTIYYDYVQANIAPYRYVTFDSSEPYLDYGTDTDYSVANFVINGTVVNPDFGINGKSVKSTGAYTNGAIVFKESEHLDNWGTGSNSWHTSFWMQRALDDNSTGLRVLWNANGYADNQNIIIYHYQNKLHVQINSQNDLPITMSTPNNVNVFDFGLHHIVLNSHHNNNQNTLTLYVDGLQVATQNIGTYQIELTNGSQHVGANLEANNFPRLGIGTLITPFASTALPVVPTNISVYFDEIYWDKNGITAGQVATLFGAMPNKVMAVIFGQAMTASAQSVMPALTTTALYLADPMTASAESGDHTVFAVLNNIETATAMTASAEMFDAVRRDNVTISAAFMLASSSIAGAGTPRVVKPAAFTVNAELTNRRVLDGGIVVNGIKIFDAQSAWVQFIKITNEGSLLPMDGVR